MDVMSDYSDKPIVQSSASESLRDAEDLSPGVKESSLSNKPDTGW